jgi:PhzF family phenazine biosynthesis protein
MRIAYFQVNAFTTETFGGNPAGVCLLESWLPDPLLQKIATENHFSETAFLVRQAGGFRLRWFTPVAEVDLCGHATLASAYVLFFERGWPDQSIQFETLTGRLASIRVGDRIELDFPSCPPLPCVTPKTLLKALGREPEEVLKSRDYLVRFRSEDDVVGIQPDLNLLSEVDGRGLIITAPGKTVDFVSRFFAPKLGVPEDPVTGSAHSALIPYWAGRLGRQQLRARQLSARGGDLFCELRGERVAIGGHAVMYCRGELVLP